MSFNRQVGVLAQPGVIGQVKTTLPVDFDLKAIILVTSGEDVDGSAADAHFCLGCGTYRGAVVQQWYHGVMVHDGNAAMQTIRLKNNDAILKLNANDTVSLAVDLEIDLISFTQEAGSSNLNAFTLDWVNLFATDIIVGYIALGGSEITDARAGTFTGSGTAGANQDVTVVASFGKPDLLMFSGCFNALGDSAADAATSLSWAKDDTERRVSQTTFDDGNASTWGAAKQADVALTNMNVSAVVEGEADLAAKVNWPTDGFRLTWGVATSGAPTWGYLALKGTFQSKIGSNTIPTSGSPPVTQDNNAGFAPKLGFAWGHNLPTTAGVDETHTDLGQFGVGVYDGTNEWWMGLCYDDGNALSTSDRLMTQTKALQMWLVGPPSLDAEADGAFTGNNFRLSFTDVGTVAREYNWLVLGDAAGAGGQSVTLTRLDRTRSIFAPTLAPGAVTLTPARLDRTRQIFAPTIAPGAVAVSLTRLDHARAIFAPTLANVLNLTLTRLDRARVISSPTMTVGAISLTLTRLDHARSLLSPTITPGAVVVSSARVDHARQIFTPTLTRGAVTVSPTRVDHARQIFTPMIITGGALALTRLDRARLIFAPTLSVGATTVSLSRVDHPRNIFAPLIDDGIIVIPPPPPLAYGLRGQTDREQVVN